jgi:sec-independent protein translocase protein TatC
MASIKLWRNPPIDDGEMTLLDHLDELRQRLFKAALGLVLGVVVGFAVAEPALKFLQEPYGREFIILGPTDSIASFFRVALMVGAILASPLITYQILMFILPGLTRAERRSVLTALPAVALLFLIGCAFAWYLLVPPAIGFLEGFQENLFKAEWTADRYLGFVTALVFWMGVAFETPLIVFVVSLLGFVTTRTLVKNWRIAIIGSAAAAAFITPTVDPVNMALVMGPLLVLYILSVLLSALGVRINRGRAAG